MFEWLLDPYGYPIWILIISLIAGITAIIYRPFATYVKFVYPNAKFEAMGNPFIKEKELNRLLENEGLSSFKDAVNSSKDYDIRGETANEVQQSLEKNFLQTIEAMRNDSPDILDEFYDMYLQQKDIYLLKMILKQKKQDQEIDEQQAEKAYLSSMEQLLKKIIAADKEEIPGWLKENGFKQDVVAAFTDENKDILLDTALDRHILIRFKTVDIPSKCEAARKRYINTGVDIQNIKHVLRAKHLKYDVEFTKKLFLEEGQEIPRWQYDELAEVDEVSQIISRLEGTSYFNALKNAIEEYHEEKSVQVLENALDQLFISLIKDISTENYLNLGPTLRFLVSKEFEIQNLKILAKGIAENLSAKNIKKLLIMEET